MNELIPDWGAMTPAVWITALGALVILAIDAGFGSSNRGGRGARRRGLLLMLMSTAVLVAALSSIQASGPLADRGGPGAVGVMLVGLLAIPALWLASTDLMANRSETGLYGVLVLLALSGAFMALGSDQIGVTWVSLELMGLASVLLVGFDRRGSRTDEATLKAFLGEALSSALLLFGFALLFGATGRLDYEGIRKSLEIGAPLEIAGLTLVLGGGLLKCGLAPFHQWGPDIDEGSSVAVMAFRTVAIRTAAIVVLLRLVTEVFPAEMEILSLGFAILAVGGSSLGSLMAARQAHIKRMISWGGVAHGGNLLVAFAANDQEAYGAMFFYLFATGVATIGALCVLAALKEGNFQGETIDDLSGLASRRPMLAILLTLFLTSLAGLPLTAGFWGKWLLLRSIIDVGDAWPALAILISSVALLYTYFRWIAAFFMRESQVTVNSEASSSELAILVVCAVVTLWLGIMPDPVLASSGEGLLEFFRLPFVTPS
ncbi:MAG: proton-conducting transporter membrane subunit [Myxococcota bacterium]|nr:proton-conducting transporter membrane subunit [Myxococcota bacterium]